jgi:RNA polymerase sigma factor (sigma-70 family)
VRYLYAVLLRQKSKLLSIAGMNAEDLVQDTFHRAFGRAGTFDAAGIDDPERMRRRARAWLGRIAHNLLADALNRVREVSATPYLERVSCDEIDAAAPESADLQRMRDALAQLSDRERDVLTVSALYFQAGEHQRLPNAVSQELALRWDTTNENIRAIRSRAMKKVRMLVSGASGVEDTP